MYDRNISSYKRATVDLILGVKLILNKMLHWSYLPWGLIWLALEKGGGGGGLINSLHAID